MKHPKSRWSIICIFIALLFGTIGLLGGYNTGYDNGFRDATIPKLVYSTDLHFTENKTEYFTDNWFWNNGYREGYIDGYFNLKEDKPFADPLEWFDIYNFKEE